MIAHKYLPKGLCAMSRAHGINNMAGHPGAAVVAGYFIGQRHSDLHPRICTGIEGELDRIIGGESVFMPQDASLSSEELFAPYPAEDPSDDGVDAIAEALARNIDEARSSGHNTIFAAIAIRALTDHPQYATPSIISGICRLIAGFDNATPGSGYYGKEHGRIDGNDVPLPEDDALPPYADMTAMVHCVITELIERGDQRRQGYGGLWHVINHAAALLDLSDYGYRDLAHRGLAAHRQHLRLFRTLPDVSDEVGPETPAAHDPWTPEYWESGSLRRDRARLTHRIKTLYGFGTIVPLIEDRTKRRAAEDKLRYLM